LANNAELDGHPLLPVRIRMLIPPLNPNGLMRQQQAIQCVCIGISADVSEVAMGEMYAPSDPGGALTVTAGLVVANENENE
jgi:hypothetical protein